MISNSKIRDYGDEKNNVRKSLSLSQHAWDVYQDDKYILPTKYQSFSGYINNVFLLYYEEAHASIEIQAEKERAEKTTILNKKKDALQPGIHYAIDVLAEKKKTSLQEELCKYPKDMQNYFRLNKEVYDLLSPASLNKPLDMDTTYSTESSYIKAVVEEFTRIPRDKREQYYYKSTYDIIYNQINKQLSNPSEAKILKIKYASGMRKTQEGRDHVHRFKPYKIVVDTSRQSIYCIGLGTSDGQKNDYHPVSYRLTRIRDCKEMETGSGKIASAEKKELENLIFERGIWYFEQPTIDITVRLSEYGETMYNNILHMRPRTIDGGFIVDNDKPGYYIRKLRCSAEQARNYFFKFGKEAEILSPIKLRNTFKKAYESTLELYRDK